MENNLRQMERVVDFIEAHLNEKLDLDRVAGDAGYSKYHLSRMFTLVVGFSLHAYIRRRRLTEAARALALSQAPIMEVALSSGYDTQQSFTLAFKALYRKSPMAYRRKGAFHPLQLKFTLSGRNALRDDRMLDVREADLDCIRLVGFKRNTRAGFFVIGQCWRRLHAKKHLIENRSGQLIGLNDYTSWNLSDEKQPAFDHLAAAQVSRFDETPRGMTQRALPPGKYMVFRYRGDARDSLQPVVEYVYGQWLPQATCHLNENARYDFAKYGDEVDPDGKSVIEFFLPIL